MKFISWNVNGLRACLKKGFLEFWQQEAPDFLCLQETKMEQGQAELALGKENWALFEASVQRSIDIINYLDQTLDQQYPISANLTQLYEYFTYELGRVKIGRRKDLLAHVKSMIGELRDAFRQAQKSGDSGK